MRVWRYLSLAVSSLLLGMSLYAEDKRPNVNAVQLENDLLYNAPGEHQDRHYTQGLKFIYLGGGSGQKLLHWIPALGMETEDTLFGPVLGQNIYTPQDDRAATVIRSDRPYAAWLYTGFALQRKGITAGAKIPVMDSYELNIGIIGPEAQGEFAQNTVHQFRELAPFLGWNNQLKTEPAFELKAGRAWRLGFNDWSREHFQFIPQIGTHLGTVMTSAEGAITVRLGWNIPDDFGPQRIDSAILLTDGSNQGCVGFYLFGRVDGRAVARNVFLDGNLYQQSHRVGKKPFVADVSYGVVMTIGRRLELSYTFLSRTREFVGQDDFDRFGSVMLKFKCGF